MTEAEWLACDDPTPMLEFLQAARLTERKLRLIACACCRLHWDHFTLSENRATVEIAERVADGLATMEEQEAGHLAASFARDMATGSDPSIPPRYKNHTAWLISLTVYDLSIPSTHVLVSDYNSYLHERVVETLDGLSEIDSQVTALQQQLLVLRDIVGTPFLPMTLAPAWRSATAVSLATAIYADRAFDRLPILADALEDAGCTNRDILDHCRQPGEHARGCWVVDLVLGKS